ncbi:MAG: glucosaminidase domain-containing protein [Bacteroidales bacterium]|nr:glucosaminidase domain-containing protein [Bacteroidales bacterium]
MKGIRFLFNSGAARVIAVFSLLSVFIVSGGKNLFPASPQDDYIKKYAAIAVSEMYRSGVPASITLAQGILESNSGMSTLATKGNNHFGIKCHDWKGKSMKHDDDAKGECFRVYDDPFASFKDHSDFLRYWDRYKFLFENRTTDYKAWANGLKKAGYATDPAYPSKLIKIIEDYNLQKFDRMSIKDAASFSGITLSDTGGSISQSSSSKTSKAEKKAEKRRRKAAKKHVQEETPDIFDEVAEEEEYIDPTLEELPPSPLSMEEPRKVEKSGETFKFSLSRPAYTRNGVPFIYSIEGDTYSSIASAYDLFPKEILRYNDLSYQHELLPGNVVYLQPKKSSTQKGLDKYIVEEDGENLRDIAQRFAVKRESLVKMNSYLSANPVLREGDTVLLREDGVITKALKRKKNR